jgi:hypothetical protein
MHREEAAVKVRRWAISSLVPLIGILFVNSVLARCGVERWSVKTGTDADVGAVDIAHPHPTTIATLGSLPQPSSGSIPADNRISPTETTVWTVQATLVEFKFENNPNSGDSDYHLVLRDAQGNTLIAEIPSPSCVDPSSPFVNGIHESRHEMDSRFTASSSFQPVGQPVEVTGVGFFDFPHGQRGHAPNFIELHPVLSLSFKPGSPSPQPPPQPTPQPSPPPAPAAGSELVVDGGFEAATDWGSSAPGWTSNSTDQIPAIIAGGSFPHSGENYAFLGGGNDLDVSLEQSVTLPAGATRIHLSFSVNVVTKERSSAAAHDHLAVEIHDGSGALLATLLRLSNRDATRSSNSPGHYFQPSPIQLKRFSGQTVTVVFHAITNGSRSTTFRIDDVTLTASP